MTVICNQERCVRRVTTRSVRCVVSVRAPFHGQTLTLGPKDEPVDDDDMDPQDDDHPVEHTDIRLNGRQACRAVDAAQASARLGLAVSAL